MSDQFDIVVPIKDELRIGFIFGLKARPPIGIILGFCDDRSRVNQLMQTVSHSTRAYLINADGLNGFLM